MGGQQARSNITLLDANHVFGGAIETRRAKLLRGVVVLLEGKPAQRVTGNAMAPLHRPIPRTMRRAGLITIELELRAVARCCRYGQY